MGWRRATTPTPPWNASTPSDQPGPAWLRHQRRAPYQGAAIASEQPLNPRYTFDAFVIGASNRFAHAAARRVAATPASAYNPLFIHGDSGLGKTHLLHAIGHHVREAFPNHHLRYVSAETFMNEFVESLRTNSDTAFKRRYRACDLLLVDDVQFLENDKALQEEFFHTFNSLYEANKQIVMTFRPPPAVHRHPRRPPPQSLRVGPHHRRATARARNPARHRPQKDRGRPHPHSQRRTRAHRHSPHGQLP